MASVFDPRSSQSRQTMHAPSAADSLPSINFGFDDLRDRMAKFTARFDDFIDKGRKRVLEERNQFAMTLAELEEDKRMRTKDIDILQMKTNTHKNTVAKEAAEKREMEAAIQELSAQRDKQAVLRDSLQKQIADTQTEIEARLAAQRKHQARQEAQARFNVPELDFWITNLCLKIEGAGQPDRLKFVFTHIDEKNWEREAWFELITMARDYDIRHCRPRLEREKVERVLERTNETRQLAVLLKGMRELFMEKFNE